MVRLCVCEEGGGVGGVCIVMVTSHGLDDTGIMVDILTSYRGLSGDITFPLAAMPNFIYCVSKAVFTTRLR